MNTRAFGIFAALVVGTAWCQGASHLQGTLRDGSQAVVPNASILCVAEETAFRFYAQSDRQGNYDITVPDGSYNIIVRHPGFRSVAKIGVLVPPGGALRVDFLLEPGTISETITVEGAGDRAGVAHADGTVLSPNEWRAIPRNDGAVTGLLSLVPGILWTPASRGEPGQFTSGGARPNTNQFSVDGVSGNNAVAGAGWPSFLPGGRLPEMTALGTTHSLAMLDAIQEVRVETQSQGADQTPGAAIILHTQPGTNDFHGSFFLNARLHALGANDWFANRYALGPDAPTLDEEGGSVGGPLGRLTRRGQTYFFLAAESLALRQGYAWTTTVPSNLARELSPASLLSLLNEFPAPNGPDLSFGISQLIGKSSMPAGLRAVNLRIDRQWAGSTRLFLRLSDTPSWSDAGFTQTVLTQYRNRVAAMGLTRTHGAWVHENRLSYSRNEAASTWPNEARDAVAFYSQNPSLAADFSNIVVGGAGTVSTGRNGRNLQNQWQASHTSGLQTSRHQLRLGLDYMDLQPVRNGPAQSVTVAFGTPTNLILGPIAPVWITYAHPEANGAHLLRASGFVEDTWRIGSQLNVTFGLRASHARPPGIQPASNLFSVDDSALPVFTPLRESRPLWSNAPVQVAPGIAAAWRLTASGDTVLRASWTRFQDNQSAASTDQLNGIPYQQLRTPTGGPADIYDASQLVPLPLGYGYSRGLRLPVYRRWNVHLEHDWRHRDSLAVSYSGLSGTGELRREIVLDSSVMPGGLIFASSKGSSQYRGLSFLYRRSLANGFQANVGYTWSRSIDVSSSDSSVFLISPTRSADADRGHSDFDVRHVLNAALTYSLAQGGHGLAGRLLSNWNFGAMVFARSGFPLDVLVSETLDGFAIANYRPTQFPGTPLWMADPSAPGGRVLNPNAFGYPFPGLAPMERNSLRGFGMWQSDITAERPLWKRGGRQLSLRADAYNVTNGARFADPVRYASNPTFGQSSSALNLMLGGGSPSSGQSPAFLMGAPRSIQGSLRFGF